MSSWQLVDFIDSVGLLKTENILVMMTAAACIYLLIKMAFFSAEQDVSEYSLQDNKLSPSEQPLNTEDHAPEKDRVAPKVGSLHDKEADETIHPINSKLETLKFGQKESTEKKHSILEDSVDEDAQVEEKPYTDDEVHTLLDEEELKPIVLFIKSKNGEDLHGYRLWKALADSNVHLSDQKHFQRFAKNGGKGELWFHVASLAQPGTFDVSDPGKIHCPGLVLILDPSKIKQLMHAFDTLIESAYLFAKELDANVLDANMQELSRLKINEWRQEITTRAASVL